MIEARATNNMTSMAERYLLNFLRLDLRGQATGAGATKSISARIF